MARSRSLLLALPLIGAGICAAVAAGLSPSTEPSHAIQPALEDLRAGRYAQAESQATELASRAVEPLPRAWLIAAEARHRLQQYASAAQAYKLFIASCGSGGSLAYVSRQLAACQNALAPTPHRLPPSRRLSADDLRELSQVSDQTFTECTDHFKVIARNARLAKVVAEEAEESLKRISHFILADQAYPHVVEIHVWSGPEDYLTHAPGAREWSTGHFSLSAANGVLSRRIDLTQRDAKGSFAPVLLDRVLPHEMCHLVTKEQFGDAVCPLFLSEGLAMLAEAEIDNGRVALAGLALSGSAKITLDDIFLRQRGSPDDAATFYAESYSFTSYLYSRLTSEQFRDFLNNVKGGCTVADALARSLYVAQDDNFVPHLAKAWEDQAISDAQFIHELTARVK